MPPAGYVPDRGDFVRAVLDHRTGREQSGERPVLVISSRRFNERTGYAFVCPITSLARGWPFEVPIPPGARVQGVILTDQTRSIDFAARHARFLAAAPPDLVETVLDRIDAILEP